jgi:hypothetical protein
MIYDGIPTGEVEPYLHARAWLIDAARLLDTGAIVVCDGRLRAVAEHTPVAPDTFRVPFPRAWPPRTSPKTAIPAPW